MSAAVLKVRMEQVAELVLIATRSECRKKVKMNLRHTLHSECCQLSHVEVILEAAPLKKVVRNYRMLMSR